MFHTFWRPGRIIVFLATIGYGVVWFFALRSYDTFLNAVTLSPILVGAIIFFGQFRNHFFALPGRLQAFLGNVDRYRVFDENLPTYCYVDYLRALEKFAALARQSLRLECDSLETNFHPPLAQLLNGFSWSRPVPAKQIQFNVGFEKTAFFADEVFWLLVGIPGTPTNERMVVHLRFEPIGVILEIAALSQERAAEAVQWLAREALAQTVFRGHFLELHFTVRPGDQFRQTQPYREMTVIFKPKPQVTEKEIVIEPGVQAVLRRNVFEFFEHRDALHALGLSRKRALLFYGPPGTGKTHTCRHIHTKLVGISSILVTGDSLPFLQDICKFARQVHPCLVFVEDVDLVFAQREMNPHGCALGDLMDELDGFGSDAEVIFILTTNAIERVEDAIKDRPGRINQCLYFGLPNAELRRRYLAQYLAPYNAAAVDMEHLVKQTERTTHAFLKEYVLRAVQIAAEGVNYRNHEPLALRTPDFDAAFAEINSHGDPHGHAIMGFQAGKPA